MFGLNKKNLQIINDYFASQKNIEMVKIFGSRGRGSNSKNSDIDFAIFGKKNDAFKIKSNLEELPTPYKFDVVLYEKISNKTLKQNINLSPIFYKKQLPFIIAIDGTASSGKSTVVADLSKKLKFIAIDTGTILRSASLYLMDKGYTIKTIDIKKAINFISRVKLEDIEKISSHPELKTSGTSEMTKKLGGHKEISAVLKETLHTFVDKNSNITNGFIISGRNIQTEVFPNANAKIFLTAKLAIRGRRRWLELKAKGKKISLKQTTEEIRIRDENDMNRKNSPLKMAKDAYFLDNSNLNEKQTIEHALKYIKEQMKKEA